MKILLLCPTFSKNFKEATNITTFNYAHLLKRKGHNVVIVAERRKNLPSFEVFQSIPILRSSSNSIRTNPIKNKFLGIQSSLLRLKKRGFYPDVIHGVTSSTLVAANTVLARMVFPKSKTIHTIKAESGEAYDKIFSPILNFVDIVTVSTTIQTKRLNKRGVKRSKMKVVNSHINTAKFHPINKKSLKKKYGYVGRKIILHYGAMNTNKGTVDLFNSMKEVIQKIPSVLYIYICRWEAKEDKFHRFVKENNLSDHVKIISGNVVIEEYAAMADIAAFPYRTLTRTESNPSCVLESIAAGTPVITSRLPELEDIFIENEDVVMVKTNDPGLLAEKTIQLINDGDLQRKLIDNALLKVQGFDVEPVTEKFIDLYQGLRGRRR